ncbi:MAG: AmmeMemoRadiSam system radical SAM enzyme [candidate division Zixibacteria bacterium 4484_95]|nr:MAG: AmmeMemoRadiSam system radical SAM enzyme [candidate division Zixibacteria bacterium 4484_95]
MPNIQAKYYEKLPNKRVKCHLCPLECGIDPGKSGICRLRTNIDGELIATGYGQVVSLAIDPMEKKPLYHFRPGKPILSTGPNGCNFKCPFCQNWTISQEKSHTEYVSPEQLLTLADRNGSVGVAFTYTEPLVWFEYVYDCSRLLKEKGLDVVLVSNGFINEEPARELFPFVDAVDIDLKSASKDFYRKVCRGNLDDVLRTIKIAVEYDIEVELTNLLIPDENDSDVDLENIVDIVADISPLIPFHISRYFPNYKYTKPPTSISTLNRAVEIARRKLAYVYPGNYIDNSDTKCPDCGQILIKREGYHIDLPNGAVEQCPRCGREVDIIW